MFWKNLYDSRLKNKDTVISFSENDKTQNVRFDELPADVEFIGITNADGEQIGVVKKALLVQSYLFQQSFGYQDILDTLSEAVIVVNSAGCIVYLNEAYTSILGIEARKVIGRYIQDVEPQSALSGVLKPPHSAVLDKDRLIHSINKHVSINITPIFRSGQFIGAVSIFSDITKINALHEDVERLSGIADEYSSEIKKIDSLKANKIIGKDKVFVDCISKASAIAKTDVSVLITGESGVGKEVIAKFIQESSLRSNKPFIRVNCSAIPENLIESELFGYEGGSFTGARKKGNLGKFELASGGTLFLDEIGEMPYPMQAKLLRVLQNGEIEKIGRSETIPVDVRIIAATNEALEDLVEKKKFRSDLYYRLNVVNLEIPPLRNRGNDVVLLADFFFKKYGEKYNKKFSVDESVYQSFLRYDWPGNVRELANIIERQVVLNNGNIILQFDLGKKINTTYQKSNEDEYIELKTPKGLEESVREYEQRIISEALEYYKGDKEKTIEALGISKRTLYRKMNNCHI